MYINIHPTTIYVLLRVCSIDTYDIRLIEFMVISFNLGPNTFISIYQDYNIRRIHRYPIAFMSLWVPQLAASWGRGVCAGGIVSSLAAGEIVKQSRDSGWHGV